MGLGEKNEWKLKKKKKKARLKGPTSETEDQVIRFIPLTGKSQKLLK